MLYVCLHACVYFSLQHPINEVKSNVFHAIVVKSDVKLRKLVDKDGIAAQFMLFLSLVFFILAIMSSA